MQTSDINASLYSLARALNPAHSTRLGLGDTGLHVPTKLGHVKQPATVQIFSINNNNDDNNHNHNECLARLNRTDHKRFTDSFKHTHTHARTRGNKD